MKGIILPKGFVWNPLIKFPRNAKCPCGNGKKYKKCHLLNMPRMLPASAVRKTSDKDSHNKPNP